MERCTCLNCPGHPTWVAFRHKGDSYMRVRFRDCMGKLMEFVDGLPPALPVMPCDQGWGCSCPESVKGNCPSWDG
jgi:hypothetical protein